MDSAELMMEGNERAQVRAFILDQIACYAFVTIESGPFAQERRWPTHSEGRIDLLDSMAKRQEHAAQTQVPDAPLPQGRGQR